MSMPGKGKVVMIESPYSGDLDRNVRYLGICMADAGVLYGECPYASHAYMTQHPRARGFFVSIERSQWMWHRCDATVFYTDRGWSRGMTAARDYCLIHKLPYEERRVNVAKLSEKVAFMSPTFCNAVISNTLAYDAFLV
jgi:hypothetical protein